MVRGRIRGRVRVRVRGRGRGRGRAAQVLHERQRHEYLGDQLAQPLVDAPANHRSNGSLEPLELRLQSLALPEVQVEVHLRPQHLEKVLAHLPWRVGPEYAGAVSAGVGAGGEGAGWGGWAERACGKGSCGRVVRGVW